MRRILIPLFLSLILIPFSGCNETVDDNNKDDWITNHTPTYSVGQGENSFWIDHPIDGSINHPKWVIDSLKEGCVVFVVHKHTCTWCDPQAQRVIALAEKYTDSFVFYDLDLDLGGDIQMKGYDSLIYDPNGKPNYIALTGIITLIENNGNITYGWHAWEGDMTKSDIEDWMKDAMYYHHVNSGG